MTDYLIVWKRITVKSVDGVGDRNKQFHEMLDWLKDHCHKQYKQDKFRDAGFRYWFSHNDGHLYFVFDIQDPNIAMLFKLTFS